MRTKATNTHTVVVWTTTQAVVQALCVTAGWLQEGQDLDLRSRTWTIYDLIGCRWVTILDLRRKAWHSFSQSKSTRQSSHLLQAHESSDLEANLELRAAINRVVAYSEDIDLFTHALKAMNHTLQGVCESGLGQLRSQGPCGLPHVK